VRGPDIPSCASDFLVGGGVLVNITAPRVPINPSWIGGAGIKTGPSTSILFSYLQIHVPAHVIEEWRGRE